MCKDPAAPALSRGTLTPSGAGPGRPRRFWPRVTLSKIRRSERAEGHSFSLAESQGGRKGTPPVPCRPGCGGLAVMGGWSRLGAAADGGRSCSRPRPSERRACGVQRRSRSRGLVPHRRCSGPGSPGLRPQRVPLGRSREPRARCVAETLGSGSVLGVVWLSGVGPGAMSPPSPNRPASGRLPSSCLSAPSHPLCPLSLGPLQDPLPAASWGGPRPGAEGLGGWRMWGGA